MKPMSLRTIHTPNAKPPRMSSKKRHRAFVKFSSFIGECRGLRGRKSNAMLARQRDAASGEEQSGLAAAADKQVKKAPSLNQLLMLEGLLDAATEAISLRTPGYFSALGRAVSWTIGVGAAVASAGATFAYACGIATAGATTTILASAALITGGAAGIVKGVGRIIKAREARAEYTRLIGVMRDHLPERKDGEILTRFCRGDLGPLYDWAEGTLLYADRSISRWLEGTRPEREDDGAQREISLRSA